MAAVIKINFQLPSVTLCPGFKPRTYEILENDAPFKTAYPNIFHSTDYKGGAFYSIVSVCVVNILTLFFPIKGTLPKPTSWLGSSNTRTTPKKGRSNS